MARPLPRGYPPILSIPCMREVADPADLEVQYRRAREGKAAILVYLALVRLLRCCGREQPWFRLPTANLQSDATPAQVSSRDQGLAAIRGYEAMGVVWGTVVEIVGAAQLRWEKAVDEAAAMWKTNAGNLASLGSGLITARVSAATMATIAYNASLLRGFHLQSATEYAAHLAGFAASLGAGGLIGAGIGSVIPVGGTIVGGDAVGGVGGGIKEAWDAIF